MLQEATVFIISLGILEVILAIREVSSEGLTKADIQSKMAAKIQYGRHFYNGIQLVISFFWIV